MTKADILFKENIRRILEEGVWSEQARPKYKDGTTANSKYITGAFMEFDLAKGEFPITTLRPIAIKSAIKELLWIYQDQSNSLELLNDKYQVHYWNDWEVGDTGTIGERSPYQCHAIRGSSNDDCQALWLEGWQVLLLY